MRKKLSKVLIVTVTTILIGVCFTFTKVLAFAPSSDVIYNGIDVSEWQGNIDYSQVRNEGIDVVYIKSSEGTNFVDPYFNENYTNAKANGLKVGFYHYVVARDVNEAIAEANFFISTISGKNPDCKLAMDFESFGDLDVNQINEIGLTFIQEVERLSGKDTVIYSDTSNATNIFGGELVNYPLWVAEYDISEPENNGKWSTWAGWQYSDMGDISGISGLVDKDRFTDVMLLEETTVPVPIPLPNGSSTPAAGGTTIIIIQRGDTLSSIAIRYNTTISRLVELNNISNPNLIYSGNSLIVPSGETYTDSDGNSTSGGDIYIVKPGDTLNKIASECGTTAQYIAQYNGIKNINLIYVNQRLNIPVNRGDLNHVLYKVKPGDTLWDISIRYGVSIQQIVTLNGIQNPNLIYPGELFRI